MKLHPKVSQRTSDNQQDISLVHSVSSPVPREALYPTYLRHQAVTTRLGSVGPSELEK